MHAILCCWFLSKSSELKYGNSFFYICSVKLSFFVSVWHCTACAPYIMCMCVFVCALAQWMTRGLNRSDIIFTMQKICQVFHSLLVVCGRLCLF